VMKWKKTCVPALETVLSTGQAQPLAPDAWPLWTRRKPDFSGAWYTYVGGPLATSTGTLSTGNVQAYIDIERKASQPPPLRYDRYLYAKVHDGRVFQAGPIKDVEYGHHREQRPSWLAPCIPPSTSTG